MSIAFAIQVAASIMKIPNSQVASPKSMPAIICPIVGPKSVAGGFQK